MNELERNIYKHCEEINRDVVETPIITPNLSQLNNNIWDLQAITRFYKNNISRLVNLLLNSGFQVFPEPFDFSTHDTISTIFLQKRLFKVYDSEDLEETSKLLLKETEHYQKFVAPLKSPMLTSILETFEKEMGGIPVCQLNNTLDVSVHIKEYDLRSTRSYPVFYFKISGQVANEKETWIYLEDMFQLPSDFMAWSDEKLLEEFNSHILNVFAFWLIRYYSEMKNSL